MKNFEKVLPEKERPRSDIIYSCDVKYISLILNGPICGFISQSSLVRFNFSVFLCAYFDFFFLLFFAEKIE